MPLPSTSLTIHGGCNCRAVRYTIEIPALSERRIHPAILDTPAAKEPNACRLPFTAWDHCNNCRTATASLLPAWLCVPAQMVTVTCVQESSVKQSPASEPDKSYDNLASSVPCGKFSKIREEEVGDRETSITRPGIEFFAPPFSKRVQDTYIRHYQSSDMRTRSFCSRCGTNICYNVSPMPESWPDMLDILLGTMDREDLEKCHDEKDGGRGLLEPDVQLWCDYGISWLRKATWKFDDAKYGMFKPDVKMENAADVDWEGRERKIDY